MLGQDLVEKNEIIAELEYKIDIYESQNTQDLTAVMDKRQEELRL